MEVVFIELDMAGFSNTVLRGRTSLHRSLELSKILLSVVVDEGCHYHQKIDITVGRVGRCIDEMGVEKLI